MSYEPFFIRVLVKFPCSFFHLFLITHLYLSLFAHLCTIYPSIDRIFFSRYFYLFLLIFIYMSRYISIIHLPINYLSIHPSIYLVSLSIFHLSMYIHPSIDLSNSNHNLMHLSCSTHLSIYPSIYLCLSIHLLYPSTYLSVNRSI